MYSADFLRRFAQLRQQTLNQAATAVEATIDTGDPVDPVDEGQRMVGTGAPAFAQAQANTVQSIVYDPVTGKAYPNPNVATAEGVTNYVSQIPSGVTIDWSYWDRFAQPEPAPAPAPAVETTPVNDQTLAFNAPEPSPPPPAPEPSPEPSPEPAPQPAPQPSPQPAPPPPPSVPQRSPPPPPPSPVGIASREQWESQGTYMHGSGHSGRNAGKSLRGDRNNDAYYANYVRAMEEANKSGNRAKALEINRAHSLLQG